MEGKYFNLLAVFSFLATSLFVLFIIFQVKVVKVEDASVSDFVTELTATFTGPTEPIILSQQKNFETTAEFTNSSNSVLYLISCFDGMTGAIPYQNTFGLTDFRNSVKADSMNFQVDSKPAIRFPRRPQDQFLALGPEIVIAPQGRLNPGSSAKVSINYTVLDNPSPQNFNLTIFCAFSNNIYRPGTASAYTIPTSKPIQIDTSTMGTDEVEEDPYVNEVGTDYFIIQAENFDKGGSGVSYLDTTPGNLGGVYRTDENIDIRSIGENEYAVYNMDFFEYMKYTIDVPQSGVYEIRQRAATKILGNSYKLKVNGKEERTYSFGSTGSWDRFFELYTGTMDLQKGVNVFEIYIEKGYIDLDYLKFTRNDDLCGNFVTQNSEQCDDGNNVSGDGCSAACFKENSNGSINCGNMDNNNDSRIDIKDTNSFIRLIGQSCATNESTVNACGSRDANRSGDIDAFDFSEFTKLYGLDSCVPSV